MSADKFVIGCEEWCSLPALGLRAIKVKVDSGAKTSALHAFNILAYTEDNKEYVKFEVHPIQGNRKIVKSCVAPLIDRRIVRSSNGSLEQRYVILTQIQLGFNSWDIEITLTNRDAMGYRMLLGREAMRNKVLVDPDCSFLVKKMSDREAIKYYTNYVDKKTALNIVLLASNPELYSNKRIMEAAEARGHNISFVNVSNCYINIRAGVPAIYHRGGEQLKEIDAVVPRLKPSMTFYGCALG
ncbi:MAG: RimK/LysX family protein [Candidatus Midichloria sp.]|nr:RimK/LysX family protein [Candidatus Midichloria sp.]